MAYDSGGRRRCKRKKAIGRFSEARAINKKMKKHCETFHNDLEYAKLLFTRSPGKGEAIASKKSLMTKGRCHAFLFDFQQLEGMEALLARKQQKT